MTRGEPMTYDEISSFNASELSYPDSDAIPVRNLVAAVIEQAVRDASGSKTIACEPKQLRRIVIIKAKRWLYYRRSFGRRSLEQPAPWTFAWCSLVLEVEPEQMRAACERLIDSVEAGANARELFPHSRVDKLKVIA
jgi:hypothetical protein